MYMCIFVTTIFQVSKSESEIITYTNKHLPKKCGLDFLVVLYFDANIEKTFLNNNAEYIEELHRRITYPEQ